MYAYNQVVDGEWNSLQWIIVEECVVIYGGYNRNNGSYYQCGGNGTPTTYSFPTLPLRTALDLAILSCDIMGNPSYPFEHHSR